MSDRMDRIEDLLHEALERRPGDRAAYLEGACGDDRSLLEEILSLLAAHEAAEGFLDVPPALGDLLTTLVDRRAEETAGPGVGPARDGTPWLRSCPSCNSRFGEDRRVCPHDGEVLVDDPESLVGATLDGLYRIEALVARGGMGVVYRARHALLHDTVAVKVLPRHVSNDPVWLKRFLREGQAARRCRHPNAVAVHDLRVTSDGAAYLVLEYVEGVTLRAELERRGRLSTEEALEVLAPIASVLDTAHAVGVVHRDVKPANVMIGRGADGTRFVKVLDLGIARLLGSAEVEATVLTGAGYFVGTPYYMSPEQWGETQHDGPETIDGRSDVYSLGVMAYEMLSGRRPFEGTVEDLKRQHVSVVPPPVHEVVRDVAPEVGRAVARAMSKDRSRRFASAGELMDALLAGFRGEAVREVSAAAPVRAPNNLPTQMTTFVGREREIGAVEEMLASARLVTLTGTGGVGKTRLSLEVASRALARFPDGVWLVELATLREPERVVDAVAAVLDVREQGRRPLLDSLIDELREKCSLLVLDSCEHLVAACAGTVAALLRGCGELRVLATSREALGVQGEARWRVASLSLPDRDGAYVPGDLAAFEAVRLFDERARLARPGFSVMSENARVVAELCRRLDGIPLAIELAAAWARILSVEQILAKLHDRFALLASPERATEERQRTLRAAVDWSHDLLGEPERALLRRLSVFAGGWTLEAAEAAAANNEVGTMNDEGSDSAVHRSSFLLHRFDVLQHLARLVDTSLVVVDMQGAQVRYRMLETIRDYARERLREAGEEPLLLELHFDWCVRLARRAEERRGGPEEASWLARLEAEHDNLRASLGWIASRRGREEDFLAYCNLLGHFWHMRGWYSEAREWFEKALSACGGRPAAIRARALRWLVNFDTNQGDYERAKARCEESLELLRETSDTQGMATMLDWLGQILAARGEYERSASAHEESLALFREIGHRGGVLLATNNLAVLALDLGEFDRAAALFREKMALCVELGDRQSTSVTLHNLGHIALFRGAFDEAERFLDESLVIAREIGYRRGVAFSTEVLGHVARERGDGERAMRLYAEAFALYREHGNREGIVSTLEGVACAAARQERARDAMRLSGAAAALREAIGAALPPAEQLFVQRSLSSALQALGPREAGRAFAEGRVMGLDRAVDYALEVASAKDGA